MEKSLSDNVIMLYNTYHNEWRAKRSTDLFEKNWLDRFCSALPDRRRRVLDLGCGSGEPIARYLIEQNCQLTGIDGASNLINYARKNFPKHCWLRADMRDLPVLERFDGIVAWHSFFHLSPAEQRIMFETFKNSLTGGGALLFTSGTDYGVSLGCFEGEPLYHSSLDSQEYRDLLAQNGFDILAHVPNDKDCHDATVWLAQYQHS